MLSLSLCLCVCVSTQPHTALTKHSLPSRPHIRGATELTVSYRGWEGEGGGGVTGNGDSVYGRAASTVLRELMSLFQFSQLISGTKRYQTGRAIHRYYSNECASKVRPFQSLDTSYTPASHCTALRCHISDAQIIV